MKNFFHLFSILFLIILLLPSVLACVDIKLGKGSYYPRETFQAEVTVEFARALDNGNIYFYQNGKEISLVFKREQIAANKYFIYAQLPPTIDNYKFVLKNVLCIENRTTKTVTKEVLFSVDNSISNLYKWLSEQTLTWPAGDDGALTLLALNYDSDLAKKGRDSLIGSAKSGDCWPFASCNVKTTALSLSALSNVPAINKNWILDSQNNVKIGLWDLIVTSDAEKQCNLDINGQSQVINLKVGSNTFLLNLPDDLLVTISTDCGQPAYVSHTYLGTLNRFDFQNDSLTLNNQKCFGTAYRSGCDTSSTAYALWALKSIGFSDEKAAAWLDENSMTTVERAISFILTSNPNMKEWLINNQAIQGYWSASALALGNGSSIEATIFSIEALKNQIDSDSVAAVAKAKAWLLQELYDEDSSSISEMALSLALIFKSSQIEPLIYFEPAVFKAKSGTNLSLKLINNGLTAVTGILSFEGKSVGAFNVNKSSSSYFLFSTPQKSQTTFTSFSLDYNSLGMNRTFSIPVLIWSAGITETDIEQSVQQETIETDILPPAIQFIETFVNETVNSGTKIHVNIWNPSSKSVEVTLLPSWDFVSENIISVSPDKVTLAANKTQEITINIGNRTGAFSGTIDAKTSTSTASIPVSLKIMMEGQELKTCGQLGGKVCNSTENCTTSNLTYTSEGFCCIGICQPLKVEPKKPSTNILLGLGILVAVIVGVIAFLLLKTGKKPKKGIGEELKKIEEHYMERIGGQTGASQ